MKINTMRNIDRFLGIPLCWLLGAVRFRELKEQTLPSSDQVRNILVIKFFGMGSILLTTPALQLMKASFPNARIGFLSFNINRNLLERLQVVDDILTVRSESLFRFLMDGVKAIRHIRQTSYDIVFDFEFFSKFSTMLSGFSRSSYRVGFELPTAWRNLILSHSVRLSKEVHVTKAFCDQVFAVSRRQEIPDVQQPILLEDDVTSLYRKVPLNGNPLVCINVNAGKTFLERRWMPDKFASLVDSLSATQPEAEFMFIGSECEQEYVQQVIDKVRSRRKCYNLAGLLTIGELSALMRRCEFLVSNDSGPLHLAAALGIPCVALYGPESPRFYGPIGSSVSIVYKAITCSPCMNIYNAKSFECPYGARCMTTIEVSEVEQAVDALRVPQ
ncbi:MAG: glycosyltransferase family 9 protein [Ignavibacteria bacterium]|nr:glycosyltransferase family 9 protein [Ignavibacteria bacterium]